MRDDGARFALVAFPPVREGMKPTIMSISEDAVPAARARRWMVLGRDSDVLTVAEVPAAQNPRRYPKAWPIPKDEE